jgi:hypothetical protein
MTIRRAALLAAVTTILTILRETIDVAWPLRNSTDFPLSPILLLVFSFYIPALAWMVFFTSLYRERSTLANPGSSRTAAWIALGLGVVLPLLYVTISGALRALSLTPLGQARQVLSWATQGTWAVFLTVYALNPDDPRIPKIAQGLVLLTGLEFADTVFRIVSRNPLELFWNDYPLRTLWTLAGLSIRIFTPASRVLVAWTFWRNTSPEPVMMNGTP